MQNKFNEEGMTTVSYMLASALSMLIIAWCTSFVVASYVRATIRGASLQASRAGAVNFTSSNDPNASKYVCQQKLEEEISNALASNVIDNFQFECNVESDLISVTTNGNLQPLGSMLPFVFEETSTRSLEELP
ncbi:MAG: hypothetical protein U0R17_03430 [Acidimicrobiia bacterium]